MIKCINLFNFSGIYSISDFYKNSNFNYFDLQEMQGVSCYFDENNRKKIKDIFSNLNFPCINLIDNGNYHYMSYFSLSNIKENFKLVLFDNHPDIQPAMFDILSCGSWVHKSIFEYTNLVEIDFLGVDPDLMKDNKDALDKYLVNLHFDEKKRKYYYRKKNYIPNNKLPIYISIDKDVLSTEYAVTNWNQGIMRLEELSSIIKNIIFDNQILGVDICGESDMNEVNIDESKKNELANSQLLRLFNGKI